LRAIENPMDLYAIIKHMLHERRPARIQDPEPPCVHAAVLVPLLMRDGAHEVLFIRRARTVTHHKGQISFPGGIVETQDNSFEETALRESFEEIGLKRKDVEILGAMDDARTLSSHYVVHPVVGSVPYPYPFVINRSEVDELIRVPLAAFRRVRGETLEGVVTYEGQPYRSIVYEYDGDVIWGATARIIKNLMDVVCDSLSGSGARDSVD
jgi:8-oxo-dGTP pyrophosphatase MutT (NUDIX family)